MNTIKKIQTALFAALMVFSINSCVQDDDWSLPPVACNDSLTTNMTMQELFNMVNSANGQILSFDEEKIVEGYVITSDSTGNLFKTLSIQNDLTNPTLGLQVEMDRTNLFNNYPNGSKIKINLKGLNVGYDRGMLKIGENYVDNNGVTRVGRMAEFKINGHVVRTCDERQYATPVEFNNITELLNGGVFNTLVTIHNVQFDNSELGNTYATSGVTVNRKLVDNQGKTMILRNSGFASFYNELLPSGSGSITVLLSAYDSNNNGSISPSEYQLFIRDTNDVKFDQPRFGDNPNPPANNFFSCLNEDFESFAVDNSTFPNYENIVKAGTRKWQIKSFGNNKYIQMGANGTTGAALTYFIVPVNFTNADKFSFKTKAGFNNGAPLKVYYSTNYNGNIDTATLVNITSSFTIATGPASGYDDNFTDSGEYSLASLSGNGVIVFAYEGNGTGGVTTTIQIDDIKITDNDDPNCNQGENPGNPEPPSGNAVNLFNGADFEDWAAFIASLNNFGLQNYASQGVGRGKDGSNSLYLNGTPSGNDYVFTVMPSATITYPANPTKITMFVKGTAGKSLSLNVYRAGNNGYDVFNVGELSTSAVTLTKAAINGQTGNGTNAYGGAINTNGQWVQVTMDLTGLNLNFTDTANPIFALKVGKDVAYNLDIDNITIE